MADKIYRYWIAVPSGLEAVALDELREYAPEVQQVEVEPGGRMGQIFFTYKRSPGRLLQLRSAVQCAGLISQMHGVTVGRLGLEYICKRIARCDLTPVKSLAQTQSTAIDTHAFALSATLRGRYRFSTAELIAAVTAVLRDKHGLRPGKGPHLLRLHLQLTGRRALFGLRLGEGIAPNAAVAYCLARLVAMQPGAGVLWARRDPRELAALQEAFAPRLLVGIRAHLIAALDHLLLWVRTSITRSAWPEKTLPLNWPNWRGCCAPVESPWSKLPILITSSPFWKPRTVLWKSWPTWRCTSVGGRIGWLYSSVWQRKSLDSYKWSSGARP